MTFKPDPKPARRIKDKRATSRALRSQPICVVCGDHGASGHHVYPKGQGGDDVPENIVSLCGHGTAGCHGLIENGDRGVRAELGAYIDANRPDVIAYLDLKLGYPGSRVWLATRLFVT